MKHDTGVGITIETTAGGTPKGEGVHIHVTGHSGVAIRFGMLPADARALAASIVELAAQAEERQQRAESMDPAGVPALVEAIRHMHGCEARHVEAVRVHETAPTGEVVWSGVVEVFDLVGHASAQRAYAWSEATKGERRRFFAVLGVGAIDSAAAAVRASILADTSMR